MEIQSEHAGGSRALPRISLTPEEAAASTGFSVRRIFQAIKDEKLTAAHFRATYPRWQEFEAVKRRVDPERLFQSGLYRRLFEATS